MAICGNECTHYMPVLFRKFESNNTVIPYQNVASLSFHCLSDVINAVYWLLVGLLTDETFLNAYVQRKQIK